MGNPHRVFFMVPSYSHFSSFIPFFFYGITLRIELYSTGNRIISPENQNFYNISITLHGFLMIFFLVMPGLFGGVGNYFVPIFQGSPEVVYPRVNNFSILILSLSSERFCLKTMPLFPWALFITGGMLLLTLPILSGALLLVLADLHSNTLFFDPVFGGDPIF